MTEFNLNASETGARLRMGAGRGTLSIGDHNVTLMIDGKPADLQKLARSISAQVSHTGPVAELAATDLKIADGVYFRDTGNRNTITARSGGTDVAIIGTLAELREAVRHLAAAVGMIATRPQVGDQVSGHTTRVTGDLPITGTFSVHGWPYSLAGLVDSNGGEAVVRVDTIELHSRTAKGSGA